ncbi:putative fermentation associated protein [Talaromyces proteolyticus]|uniref:Fermentation associated protein n=1 Tax=Talaromyces proteolyticus TaxID=1131652 RepID=A0AAD4L5X4_9EURO|nr:putative fermentation associated protein [Talaromyces proteolyticus]KAH8705185.1 putative fermentation associated protein [Talaromyces proteolyticus]
MVSTTISLQPLSSGPQFNWFFLVELIVCGILVLFFLFYFNRLFATLVSYGIRAYTWHYHRAYVDIQALQISLLGGRIFFKGVRYHGVNETVLIQRGYLTWNYWKRTVRNIDLARNKLSPRSQSSSRLDGDGNSTSAGDSNRHDGAEENGGVKTADSLPCRLTATVFGLEWFLYNRTPAYDDILSGFTTSMDQKQNAANETLGTTEARSSSREDSAKDLSLRFERMSSGKSTASSTQRASPQTSSVDAGSSSMKDTAALNAEALESASGFLNLLPIQVECTKGAIVAGNENTRSLLTITFEKGTGVVDAADAGPLDIYRQVFTFDFARPIIQLRRNPDFRQEQHSAARKLTSLHPEEYEQKPKRRYFIDYQRRKRQAWHTLRDLIPYFQKSVESFHDKSTNTMSTSQTDLSHNNRWLGLTRYQDETTDDHEGWNAVEYGRYSTILDCPSLNLTYYWDIPGKVPTENDMPSSSIHKFSGDINGSNPPEWGIDIKIERGTINYGPWTDRERVGLQNVFFPNNFRSAQPAESLKPGSLRQSTKLKIRVETSDETTLRISTREESKDWQWKGRANAIRSASKLKKQKQKRQWRGKNGETGKIAPETRPFGWLTLRISHDSTITYEMDMVASKTGYCNQLNLDLRECKLSSSVNHGLLWQSPRQVITCDLSNPLTWNSLHTWSFTVVSHDLQLFLLRDHIILLTDLVSDWTSNSSSEFYTFVPYVYNMKLFFTSLSLYLNLNDSNIINNPSDLDDNTFIAIRASQLASNVSIPSDTFRPEQSLISFSVDLEDGIVDLLTPLWHTLHTFLRENSLGTLSKLNINGSYTLNAGTSPALTDSLTMDITADSPRCYLYGFLIKYFMKIRENYFAENMHFRTLEEFQESANSVENRGGQGEGAINPNRKSNDLDVIITLSIEWPCALLPTNIYDHSKCLRLTAASLDLDIRFTNYYMDLQANLTPTEVALETAESNDASIISNTQLFIDGLSVYGHRIFGLPPTEPTYVCNWDFNVGKIVGECNTEFIKSAASAFRNLDFTFDDEENALPPLHPSVLHDVTFLRARIGSLHLTLLVDQVAVSLGLDCIEIDFNDWSRLQFSKRLSLRIPNIKFYAIDRRSAARRHKGSHTVTTYALFETSLDLSMLQRKANFLEDRKLQQDHIRVHDERSHRTPWLLLGVSGDDMLDWNSPSVNPPAMILPSMPEPVVGALDANQSFAVPPRDHKGLTHQSSFLSFDNSSFRGRKENNAHGKVLDSKNKVSRSHFNENSRSPQLPIDYAASRNYYDDDVNDTERVMNGPSSFWAIPHFHYHQVRPDSSNLPTLPDVTSKKETTVENDDYIMASNDDKTAHTDIFCTLTPGLRGFCTPEFFHSLSLLVDGLQSTSPVDMIDSLQTQVISDIVKHEKSKKNKPKSATSISIRIPSAVLNLLNRQGPYETASQPEYQDEYRLSCLHFQATYKTESERREQDLIKDSQISTTIHSASEMLSFTALGRQSDTLHDQAELTCVLRETVFWSVNSSKMRSHVQMRSFETSTSSKSVAPLALLVKRTTTLADSIATSFQEVPSTVDRLRYVVWSLTDSAAGMPDPLFLTRPAYVLRASQHHLRLHDSWKIISRLRNIYKNLSPDQQRALKTSCTDLGHTSPKSAKETVLENFNEWRPWDLAHVEKSHVMKAIWGESTASSVAPNVLMVPIAFSCNIKGLSFIIDPGPKQSDIMLNDILIAYASSLAAASDHETGTAPPKKTHTIRCYSSNSALRLRWEILDLLEEIAATMSNIQLASSPATQHSELQNECLTELHIFVGTDEGSISLDGINLTLYLSGNSLKSSLALSPSHNKQEEQITAILSAEDCSTIFSSRSKVLMLWEIWQPHVYGSHISKSSPEYLIHDWKLACSCRSFTYNMQEDPLGLIHVADKIVEDEIRHVSTLIQLLNKNKTIRSSSEVIEQPKGISETHQFHVALFLDDYQINFRLLPSLTYIIDGKVARMSVLSNNDNGLEVDFDVKSNHHIFKTVEEKHSQSVSEIDIPPINGRILGNMLPSAVSLKADVTVELIRLEASSLRSLLSAFTRPEISHFMSDCTNSLSELRLHLSDILAHEQKTPTPHSPASSVSREILYNVRLTMAGWEIHARAPGIRSNDYWADMNFTLGSTQIHLDTSEQRHDSSFPDFHVNVSQVGLELKRRERSYIQQYGKLAVDIGLLATSGLNERNEVVRTFNLTSKGLDVQLYAETTSLVIDIAVHLQDRIKKLDLSEDMKRFRHLGRLARPHGRGAQSQLPRLSITDVDDSQTQEVFGATYLVEFTNIQISWIMDNKLCPKSGCEPEDLVFSIRRVSFSTSRDNSAKLRIQDTQLQMAPKLEDKRKRSLNSALMPEIVFNVAYLSTKNDLRLAFQAAGKSLDIRGTTGFILPARLLQSSIASAAESVREAKAIWATSPSQTQTTGTSANTLFGNKKLSSVLVDVDFAGAIVTLLGRQLDDQQTLLAARARGTRRPESKYGHYTQGDSTTTASLTSPGVALKVQYGDNGVDDPTLNAELRVNPSSNTLYPTVVPLIKQISSSVKEVVGDQEDTESQLLGTLQKPKKLEDSSFDATNPESILGRCKLNLGLRICKQEFGLSCQPIARVAATAKFEDIFVTVNTVQSAEHRRFFAILISCNSLQVSVKHVYSNESTASFEVQSMVMSLMNSKHVSTTSGISAILKMSPVKMMINAKQFQDFLLFREIWVPSEDDLPFVTTTRTPNPTPADSQALMVRRYQQVASAQAFPWNTVISIEALDIQIDLGQTLGKAEFGIKNMWVSSKKSSDWEQNLCGGFDVMSIESKGRMSGSVALEKMKVRTSIQWPDESPPSGQKSGQTPLIQASVGFAQLQANASFEYQPFLVADIVTFDFLMYNVRTSSGPLQDRLVSILEGDKVQVFCTTMTASQSLALYQTWNRFTQDKYAAYESSLKEIERYFRRKSSVVTSTTESPAIPQFEQEDEKVEKAPISLHTDVVVTIRAINVGAFPSSFFDNQIFKMEALDAQARFAVYAEDERIHSSLGLTLGELRVALSSINRPTTVEMEELSVAEVAARATGSRGGTILKVPRVVASMETWQAMESNEIDYIFKSAFEGKVDVGWNYSRISFIRGMWTAHSRALANRLGKPLPPSAVRITGGPKPEGEEDADEEEGDVGQSEGEKITAVVNVPQSKYTYRPLEPPLIETPQLRDMGDATPPLEWIGLNRDRLPNITHQIIIVTLSEVAKEVADAYSKILG